MSKFEEFLNHEDLAIKGPATLLAGYEMMLNNEMISASEFQELANDVLEYEVIDELSDDIERQVIYKKAFEILKKIVSGIGGL